MFPSVITIGSSFSVATGTSSFVSVQVPVDVVVKDAHLSVYFKSSIGDIAQPVLLWDLNKIPHAGWSWTELPETISSSPICAIQTLCSGVYDIKTTQYSVFVST